MLTPNRLLDAKADDTPGDAVSIEAFLSASDFYIKPSGDLTTSSDIEVFAEISDAPAGPWRNYGNIVGNINTGNAGKLLTAPLSALNGRWIGYIRLRLSASPITGNVTVDLYARS